MESRSAENLLRPRRGGRALDRPASEIGTHSPGYLIISKPGTPNTPK